MNTTSIIIAVILLSFFGKEVVAQTRFEKVIVDTTMKDTFSFATKWDYSWDIFKDGGTGVFSKIDGGPINASDTAHLFYTANCSTNVQGGYQIRYCLAEYNKGVTRLLFSDGLPAYASEYYLYIERDSFYFKPRVIYPRYISEQKSSYQVTKQTLILNKSKYRTGEIVIGYVDIEFVETVSTGNGTKQNHYYLKGYFRSPLKRSNK